MEKEKNKGMQVAVLALIERFEYLEEETGVDFTNPKRIILRWARKNKLFEN